MAKVIILAGAPDAASLDWSTLESETDKETAQHWQGSNSSSLGASNHPQWRVVPSRAVGNRAAQTVRPETHPPAASDQAGAVATGQLATASNHRLLYSRADFVTLTPVTLESTQELTQDSTHEGTPQTGSLALSSLDEASLSLRLPGALPQLSQQLSQQLPPFPETSFRSEAAETTTISQEFFEHSLAVHNALPSSLRLFDLSEAHGQDSFEETVLSLSQSLSFTSTLPRLPADIPRWQPLTHLVDVPSAAYLLSLAPQTVTVNLVAAVVSVSTPRVVNGNSNNSNNSNNNRRNHLPASLVELMVGDETRSGFGLTIWMDGGQQAGGPSSLATLLPTLAPHDVVLLRHVALHAFGDKVYGSSLRKDQTKMHILHRGKCGRRQRQELQGDVATDDALFSANHLAAAARISVQAGSPSPANWQLLAKTTRVRDWALRYVLVDGVVDGDESLVEDDGNGPRPKMRQTWMLPPADTQ